LHVSLVAVVAADKWATCLIIREYNKRRT